MPRRKNQVQKTQKSIDTFSAKRGRGRPWKIRHSEVIGRAGNYRGIFARVWPRLRDPLLATRDENEVIAAFENHAQPYAREFVPRLAPDILEMIRDPKFPKMPKAQINFLADSLSGRPNVTLRTSRDICAKGRAKERAKSPHKIIRKEFYIVCSCGYKGPALNDACRKCGAEIDFLHEIFSAPRLF
jgi:hypothetical protein